METRRDFLKASAAAEVNEAKLDQWMTPARQTFKLGPCGRECADSPRLPYLLALESIKQGKPLGWDAGSRTVTPL